MTDISKNTELQQSCITAVITMLPTEKEVDEWFTDRRTTHRMQYKVSKH
jgi:hypothetical protein